MRRPAWLATALAGCLVPNPAYDPQAASASAGATSTSAGASTSASAPGTDSTDGGESAGGSTGAAATSTGATSTGGAASSAGANTTTASCDACGECEACDAGQCAPKPAGTACETAEDLPCEQRIWGYVSGGCAVMKESDVVACDEAGTCRWQCADAPGAVPFKCDELSRPEPGHCVNGEDAATLSIDDVCVIDGPAKSCTDRCIEVKRGEFATESRVCKAGKCEASGVAAPCGHYACRPDGTACEKDCSSDEQCAPEAECDEMSGECDAEP